MAVIWGFDLSQMSWGAFSSKRMFDRRWYMRKDRFIFYQLAMLIALAAECTATYSLSKYDSLQDNVQSYSTAFSPPSPSPQASLHNDDIIDSAILTIVFCVLVATVFGADFFFLLFWPERMYPAWYRVAKRVLAVIVMAGVGAAAITSTVVISTRQALITGVSDDDIANALIRVYYRPPLVYRKWAVNIAWLVLLWITFAFTVASTLLMLVAVAHDEEFGPTPKSIHDEKERQNIANRAKEEDQAPMIALAESRQVVPSNRHLGIEQRGGI